MSAWTKHRIFALRTLCNEATPGPWEVYPDYAPGMRVAAPNPDCPDEPFEIVVGPTNHHDWVENDAFIAAARTELPEALDEIERCHTALIRSKNAIVRKPLPDPQQAQPAGDPQPHTVALTDRELGALLATVAWIEDEPIAKALSDLYARAINEDTATTETRYAANRKGAARYNQIDAQQTQPDLRDVLQVLYDGAMRWVMVNAMNKAASGKIAWAPNIKDIDGKAQESLRDLLRRVQRPAPGTVIVDGVTRCACCGSSRKHWKNTGTNALAQQAQPDLRDAMIEALESTPYSSIEFAPGLRYLRETIIAGLTQATRI